jgi:amylovoran biosynthesis glycosyltransferase AmsD
MQYILFHHSFEKLAGTERVLFNIIEYLATTPGAKITLLLASSEKPLALNLDAFSLDLVYLDVDLQRTGFFDVLGFHARLYNKLGSHFAASSRKEKVVCIATNPMLAAIAFYAGRKYMPALSVISCEHFALAVSGRLSKLIRKVLYKDVHVVALTKGDQLEIVQKYKPKSCVCIPNAIPFALHDYAYNPDKKTILAIGRLTHQKGFDLLISSFSLIAKQYPDWVLTIVGDDYGDLPALKQMIADLDLGNVLILPATPQINEHYENACFFALSSRFEGLPMVLLEAMGYGLPIVAFNCPTGPAELVDDSNGFLVENGNLQEFAQAMEGLIRDKETLLAKARGAEEKAKQYTKAKINLLWESFLETV